MTRQERRGGGASVDGFSRAAAFACLAAAVQMAPAAAQSPREAQLGAGHRVLLLSSYGSEFSYFSQVVTDFRLELDQLEGTPCDFYQVALELARFDSEAYEKPFLDYVNAIVAHRRPELVVTFGGPAARFVQVHRERLFPDVPLLYAAVDSMLQDSSKLSPLDAIVPLAIDLAAAPEAVLQLLPDTRNLAIILGSSPLERYWRRRLEGELARFEPRLRLMWLDGLTLEATIERVASLPPHSAVFLVMLLVDEKGAAYSQSRVLAAVRGAAKGPVFGIFDNQVGAGVVGGRVVPTKLISRRTAEAAARLLEGTPPAAVRMPPIPPTTAVFDGRELERWSIPESRLPAESEIRFLPVSPLVRYRWPIVGAGALLVAQSMLIAGLLLHRARRRDAENEVRALHGRLLTTFEQERRRLARELHDDFTQRLARLAIDAAQVERHGTAAGDGTTLPRMREELVQLSDDVHTLSRRLHPSILDDLGLAEALRSEVERFAHAAGVEVELRLAEPPAELPLETALCLYRVAQEALRNIAHYAQASRVEVILHEKEGGLELGVRDDGVGFDATAGRKKPGLGHVSLRERLHLVGGQLEITSVPGKGTIVIARVPLPVANS